MNLSSLQLNIQNPEQSIAFYTKIFGMTLIKKAEKEGQVVYTLRYPNGDSYLELFHNQQNVTHEKYQENRLDNYWKYSVFVEDIQQSYYFLKNQNILTNKPYQFGDIGYLMHLQDKENYQVEFIQKTFKQNSDTTSSTNDFAKEIGNISLGLITIRTKDPVKSIHFFESFLDMKLLLRMHVNRGNGFSLYFLGGKNLNPPNTDLDAIENREWLYRQTEPFIELQYYWGSEYQDAFKLNDNHEKNMGLRGIKFRVENLENVKRFFNEKKIDFSSNLINSNQKETIQILSPDKQVIVIE